VPVVFHHAVGILVLPADPAVLFLDVRAEVHARGVPPHKEGLAGRRCLVEVLERARGDLVVDGLHALAGERAGVFDLLRPVRQRPAVDHPARPEALAKCRVRRVVLMLGLLFGVEVGRGCRRTRRSRGWWADARPGRRGGSCRTAPLHSRAASAARRLWGPRTKPEVGTRQSHLCESGAQGVLPGDERRTARGTALLPVVVGERDALVAQAIDVRGLYPSMPRLLWLMFQ